MRDAALLGWMLIGLSSWVAGQTEPYAGSETCVRCHASDRDALEESPHAWAEFEAISEHGCESCHGPGSAHVQDPANRESQPSQTQLTADERREVCLGCHEDSGHDREHFASGVDCSSCHAIHAFDEGVTGAAGDARCVSCHESSAQNTVEDLVPPVVAAGFRSRGTPHSSQSCSSCHTLGSLAEPSWEGREGIERCQTCHGQSHPRFSASSHARAGLACTSCHSVHAGDVVDALAPDTYLGRASQICTECHATTVSEFTFNERHRLEEGVMECSSCHDPHEPTQRVRLGGFKDQLCTACHVDKRGPFIFEHGASLVEGCTSCHVPHGSPNRHMLEFSSVADQCYSCHVSVPGFHARFTSQTLCTNCHSTIHGSNLHPAFLK